jgi:hypothetical protein
MGPPLRACFRKPHPKPASSDRQRAMGRPAAALSSIGAFLAPVPYRHSRLALEKTLGYGAISPVVIFPVRRIKGCYVQSCRITRTNGTGPVKRINSAFITPKQKKSGREPHQSYNVLHGGPIPECPARTGASPFDAYDGNAKGAAPRAHGRDCHSRGQPYANRGGCLRTRT